VLYVIVAKGKDSSFGIVVSDFFDKVRYTVVYQEVGANSSGIFATTISEYLVTDVLSVETLSAS